ncbi:hypothetical protein [Dysgonomonas sp.]
MKKFITIESEREKYTINTEYIVRVDHKEDGSGILRIMTLNDLNLSLIIDQDTLLKLIDYLGFNDLEDYKPGELNLNLDDLK